jgi:hypothetical protein
MGEREHGAKGLCQERAFVSGLQAANALAESGELGQFIQRKAEHPVIPIRADETQVRLLVTCRIKLYLYAHSTL